MQKSVEDIAREFRELVARDRKNSTPAKARAFLLRAGIAEKCKSAPNGIRLAKRFR